jgi:bifunctional non-homologous end joining protein LigD
VDTKKAADPLARYWSKRNFGVTSEPRGEAAHGDEKRAKALSFVIQKHHASRLHYDFRLELDGVLLSWAVPKGPSYDPSDKRMAIHVEDHPLSYGSFEGTIPPKQYGAGTVIVWDNGTWEPAVDPHEGLKEGKLVFALHGHKMAGLWELVRIAKPGDRQEAWLLFKKKDAFAKPHAEYDVVSALPDSVITKPPKQPASAAARSADDGADDADDSAELVGALKAPLPAKLEPQLATLATAPPGRGEWSWEIKLDGYRLMTRIQNGTPQLITRGGHDWTSKMPKLAKAIRALGIDSAWLDGEIVVLGETGLPDFNALQNAFDSSRTANIVYFLFDLPYFEGYDLRKVPLASRRRLLKHFLDDKLDTHTTEQLRFSAAFDADAASILHSAARMGLEGAIAKRKDSIYESRRTETWLKLKVRQRQEFVIAGYTDRSSGEAEIGSLLLGVQDDAGKLVYVGNVGAGWSADAAAKLRKQLQKLAVGSPPFASKAVPRRGRWTTREAGGERWVEPKLVAEVEFSDWTPDGHIRHAKYLGLRTDRSTSGIVRERAITPATAPTAGGSVAGIKVSNPERVIDASTGITKLELVRYYESVAEWMLPHLKGRPCSLLRGPSGLDGQLFFQKHADTLHLPEVKELDPALFPGHAALLEVPTTAALVGAAQMNVIEFHTWNSGVRRMAQPDRLVFDLDPGEGVRWDRVQEGALLTHTMLLELGLESWLKTSGGKGLHVVVPLTPRHDWDTTKDFAKAIVEHLARVIPDRFVAKSGPKNRVGKIFVDYLRNSHGATTAAAFSARARPGLGVSMPIAWDDLKASKRSDQWTVRTAREHLSFQTADPWADYWTKKQTLTAAMKTLGFKPAKP